MASTTLFAPQVSSVQPAFTYSQSEGRVKIYFSLSAYNKKIDFRYVGFSIIDPNKTSTWGDNSMIRKTCCPSKILAAIAQEENDKFYIELNLSDNILFKTFTKNQYYQVQLYLINTEVAAIEGKDNIFAVSFDTLNGNFISQPSQITLIRPIPLISTFVIEGSNDLLQINCDVLTGLKGFIEYDDKSTIESIKNYYFIIKKDGEEVYKSEMFYNTLGLSFSADIYDCFLPDGEYDLILNITTLNDYNYTKSFLLNLGYTVSFQPLVLQEERTKIGIDKELGSVSFELWLEPVSGNDIGKIAIQRSSEDDSFNVWKTLFSYDNFNIHTALKWSDCYADANKLYKYRIIFTNSDINYYSVVLDDFYIIDMDDIFLSNEEIQMAIRFNPNISGLKYVSQESVTNTLGGRYPVIRINGETKYRQFTLSGTLSFQYDWQTLIDTESYDSRNASMLNWFSKADTSMTFNLDLLNSMIKSGTIDALKSHPQAFERKFREMAINFLNDRRPKLFRSATEGNMIVYLSGVSFTPNKQLGRNIYDFSATVTEICDLNDKNLRKYNILYEKNIEAYVLYYLLKVKGDVTLEDPETKIQYSVPYVGIDEIVEYEGRYVPIVHMVWEKLEV